MSQMRPGDFRFTGAFLFLAERTKQQSTPQQRSVVRALRIEIRASTCSPPATLSNTVREARKNWGFSHFIGDVSMEMPPLIEKLTAMNVRGISDFQNQSATIH